MASRIFAERGYAGASISALTKEADLPTSAIYHHFGSKAGLLSAVMQRGAQEFFDSMRAAHAAPPSGGTHFERLSWYLAGTADAFAANPDFLRLHMILVLSSEAASAEVTDIITAVRSEGRAYMNQMIRSAFEDAGPAAAQRVADSLDYFGIAGFDGAFIASQADPKRIVATQMVALAQAVAALGEHLLENGCAARGAG